MEFDPKFGLVERGTAGHRASAEVVDVDAEIRAMHRIMSRPPYDMDLASRRYAHIWLYGGGARNVRSNSSDFAPAYLYAGLSALVAQAIYNIAGDDDANH